MGRNDQKPNRNNQNSKRKSHNRNRKPGNKTGQDKKRSFNKNRRPKKLTPSRLIVKYQNFMEQYLLARKKFFDVFGHKNAQQVDKAKRNYATALKNLREFEKGLEDWQAEVLKSQLNFYPEDRDYSTSREIAPSGDTVSFTGEFEDPHLLPDQKASDWSQDTDESAGSMEDYYAYKGITPPVPEEDTNEEIKQ